MDECRFLTLICVQSLIVAFLRALESLAQMARANDDAGIGACIAECILSCLASIVEYFNKWYVEKKAAVCCALTFLFRLSSLFYNKRGVSFQGVRLRWSLRIRLPGSWKECVSVVPEPGLGSHHCG